MLDSKRRISIPKGFLEINPDRKVYIYYSVEEKLFYLLPSEDEQYFLTAIRISDAERRIIVPIEVLKKYETNDILLAKKGNKVYLIPD